MINYGLHRVSRGGAVNEGRDGGLILPEHRVAIVADGVGNLGLGQDELLKIQNLLNSTKGDLRKAMLYSCDSRNPTVLCGLKWPEHEGEKGLIFNLGDCEAFRIRGKEIDQISGPVHTAWETIKAQIDPMARRALEEAKPRAIQHELSVEIYRELERVMKELEMEDVLRRINNYALSGQLAHIHTKLNAILMYSTSYPVSIVRGVLGSGMEVDLAAGDRVVMCSDGITDNLDPDEIREALSQIADAKLAAIGLVTEAQNAYKKVDDMVAAVMNF